MGSLQDALRDSGLAREESGTSKPHRRRGGAGGKRANGGSAPGKGRPGSQRSIDKGANSGKGDLEHAWAARRRAEKAEQERAKQARLADQEARRRRNLELDRLIDGRVLNTDDAELPRYFEHLGRIRRVLCTPEQRSAINAGTLGVVSLRGRYLIVEPDVLESWRDKAPDLVPDLSGKESGGETGEDWPPVPDDLTW